MKIFFKTLWLLSYLIFIIIAIMPLSEWWTVGYKKNYEEYAFGLINENPWFYETPELYSKVMLIEGIILTILISLSISFAIKKNYNKSNIFLMLFLFTILILLLNSN